MKLTIRKMTEEDFEPLYLLLSDPQVMKYLEPPFSKEQTQDFLNNCGLCEPPRVYAVDDQDGFAGYVIFHDYDETSLEVGWVLYPKHWGKGYASELTEQLITKGKNLHKQLVIECDPDQKVTEHIALKHGFTFEGTENHLSVFRKK